jgi:hypothetical protein
MSKKNGLSELPQVSKKEIIQRAKKFAKNFCITDGKRV